MLEKLIKFIKASPQEASYMSFYSLFNGLPLNTELKFYPHDKKGESETTTIRRWFEKNTVPDGILITPKRWVIVIKQGQYSCPEWDFYTWHDHVEVAVGLKLYETCEALGLTREDLY